MIDGPVWESAVMKAFFHVLPALCSYAAQKLRDYSLYFPKKDLVILPWVKGSDEVELG